jgi:hypothetical protein
MEDSPSGSTRGVGPAGRRESVSAVQGRRGLRETRVWRGDDSYQGLGGIVKGRFGHKRRATAK